MTPFAAFDIEASDWDRFLVAALATENGAVDLFRNPEALGKAISKRQGRVYAHYGGKYDFMFLPPMQSIFLSGSGILTAQLGTARLYDSGALMPMKLATIGKAIGRDKLEGRSDRIGELTSKEVDEHCINDALILVEALVQHRKWTEEFARPGVSEKWPATSGSTAIYCCESLEREYVSFLRRQVVDIGDWHEQIAAVCGGRVEIFRHGRVSPVFVYDINSSYPFSWLEEAIPLGPWMRTTGERDAARGVYWCDRIVQSREHLPVVSPEHVWRHDGAGWVTSEELRSVRECGGEARVKHGWISSMEAPFGHKFVKTLYARKLAGDPWAKVSLNSLHGKFSQGLVQSSYYLERDGSYGRDLELCFPTWFQRPLTAAFVLARARRRLWSVMDSLVRSGHQVYYCDTDSIHTSASPDEFRDHAALGSGCGEWKLEHGPCNGVYVAPKVYALTSVGDDNPVKMVCKGFSPTGLSVADLEKVARGGTLTQTREGGLIGFRSLLKWGPKKAIRTRTLASHTGGKTRRGNRLVYPP